MSRKTIKKEMVCCLLFFIVVLVCLSFCCCFCFVPLENIRQQVEAETKQLLAEVEAERSHHQKMLKDYDRLQQRFENLQDEVEILQSPQKDQGKSPAFYPVPCTKRLTNKKI